MLPDVKKLQGTLRSDRENGSPATYDEVTEVPKSGAWMLPAGKKYFKNCCEMLIEKGMLNTDRKSVV